MMKWMIDPTSRAKAPCASSSAAIASSETRGPESVIERGPLKAEIVTVRS